MTKIPSQSQAALVTGGAKRIGRAIALGLANRGFDIALHCGRSQTDARKAATEIKKAGVHCEIFPCNLGNEKDVLKLMSKIKARFRNLSLLVNNASIFQKSRLNTKDLPALKHHFAVNFTAPYILSCDFANLCGKGQIVNILDTHIVQNKTSHPAYLLSKKSLAELTKMSAVAFGPRVRVNGIAPGLILPPSGAKKGHLKSLSADVPMRTKGDVSQIVAAVNFLLDNGYVTGQIIFNDGGEHLL